MVQVEQDGSFKFVDVSNRGGRTFFGLGSLLTGYKVNTCINLTLVLRGSLFSNVACVSDTQIYQKGARNIPSLFPYLSFLLRVDPLHFQAGDRKSRPNVGF